MKPDKVEKVSVICDHIDIAGNYYNDCKGGDSLTIRHGDDLNEVDAPGKVINTKYYKQLGKGLEEKLLAKDAPACIL